MGIAIMKRLALCVFIGMAAAAHADELVRGKVIYGNDDRIDVYQETNSARLQWAAATCALIDAGRIVGNSDGTFTIKTDPYRQSGRPACAGEPFGNQPTASFCSGFLAAPDVIVTAGHCINGQQRLLNTRYVFGFVMQDANTPETTLLADQVYLGVEILGTRYESVNIPGSAPAEYDFSVVRLDRPVTTPGVEPLPIRRAGTLAVGSQVGVIGYPAGLPKKIAFGEQTVVQENKNDGYFIANLDTYGGNSGSPVFNALTGIVEGVLVRGNRDFLLEPACFNSNRLSNDASGEDVSKSLSFAHFVPLASEGEPEGSVEGDEEGQTEGERHYHSADTNRNGIISLSETLRVIQFYNADKYSCSPGTEDGYSPLRSDLEPVCTYHDSDYNPADFQIGISEVLRLIQIYNTGHYVACDEGEDGYCF
jgi:hypothetical protein